VYRAVDRERGTPVALKTLKRIDPASIARLKREFRVLADFAHPNLVSLYELVVEGDDMFFTMELVEGVDFLSWVRRGAHAADVMVERSASTLRASPAAVIGQTSAAGSETLQSVAQHPDAPRPPLGADELDVPRLRQAMRQLAEGVACLHDAGMLHRDLKPSNVLVDRDGRVVIMDFGVSTELAAEALDPDDRALIGTPSYMAPEQGARQALSPASDWYSVGVILYAALTGRLPFVGGQADILMDKQQFEPPPPDQIATGVPDDLNALCVDLLRRSPRDRPPANDILRRLDSQAVATLSHRYAPTTTVTRGPLVGRERHLAALHAALADTELGPPVLVNLAGESGMGKSTLLTRFLEDIDARSDALVLRGRCFERESVAFKAFDSLIDGLSSHLASLPPLQVEGLMPRDALALARVFPVLRQVDSFGSNLRRSVEARDPFEIRRRAFTALRDLFARLADRGPLVLAIDDVQWGDVDSAILLSELLHPPDPPAMLVICGYRSEEEQDNAFLAAFRDRLDRRRTDERCVAVTPLAPAEARELALSHLGPDPRARAQADRIARESTGSPLFVEELSRYAMDALDGEAAPELSLEDLMHRRLQRLPADATRLSQVVALAGRPMAQALAFRAADVTDPAALSLLKAGSFVRTRSVHGERFVESYHDRVREAVVAALPADQLATRHRRIALALERSPSADPEALAIHFAGAGDRDSAARYAEAAASRATESFAFDRAARLYRMALELGVDRDPHARRTLVVALGDALSNAGRGLEAARAYLSAGESVQRADRLDLQRRASRQFFRSGHLDEGIDTIAEVLASEGMQLPGSPRTALASLLWQRARIRLRGLSYREREERDVPASTLRRVDALATVAEGLAIADPLRAAGLQGKHLQAALSAGEPRRIGQALAYEAAFVSLVGARAHERVQSILSTMRAIAERTDDALLHGVYIGIEGIIALHEARFADAATHSAKAVDYLRANCHGANWETSTANFFLIMALTFNGRLRDVADLYETVLRDAREVGDLYAETSMRTAAGFYLHMARDRVDEGRADIEDAMRRWSPRGFQLQHAHAFMSRTSFDMYEGDGERAWQRVVEAWPKLARSGLMRAQVLRVVLLSYRARSALMRAHQLGPANSETRRLIRLAKRTASAIRREGTQHARAMALSIEAVAAHRLGQAEQAIALLEDSETGFEQTGAALEAAAAMRTRGVIVGGSAGAELVARADARFHAEGIEQPDRMANLTSPGFAPK